MVTQRALIPKGHLPVLVNKDILETGTRALVGVSTDLYSQRFCIKLPSVNTKPILLILTPSGRAICLPAERVFEKKKSLQEILCFFYCVYKQSIADVQ